MQEAAKRGHRVLYVETSGWVGTYIVRRGTRLAARLRRLASTERLTDRVSLHRSLNLLPFSWRASWIARVNATIDAWRLRQILKQAGFGSESLLLIYDPRAIDLALRIPHAGMAYDCVDDYEQIPTGRASRVTASYDRLVAQRSDVVFATSEPLVRRHRKLNPETYLVPNVADFEHFAAGEHQPTPPKLASLAQPLIGFAGNIVEIKVNTGLLRQVAQQRPHWSLVLIGPVENKMQATIEKLCRLSNVSWLGLVPYQELPAYVTNFNVGLIPYRANAYTASCFPLKFYEYLAAGIPIVASGLPSLPVGPDLIQVASAEEMIQAIESQLTRDTAADRQRRRQLAAQHTWSDRAEMLLTTAGVALSRSRRPR